MLKFQSCVSRGSLIGKDTLSEEYRSVLTGFSGQMGAASWSVESSACSPQKPKYLEIHDSYDARFQVIPRYEIIALPGIFQSANGTNLPMVLAIIG